MRSVIRRGMLEVETDLLLGADSVLLPVAPVRAPDAPQVGAASSTRSRSFDAALFAGDPRASDRVTVQKSAGTRSVEPHKGAPAGATPVVRTPSSDTPIDLIAGADTGASAAPQEVVPLVDRIRPPAAGGKSERLEELARSHAAECPHCTTATGYEHIVFGEGNPEAELVFVGEAPGETEDRLGRPFVGRAGEKLDEMIGAMGLSRADVYIANVLKSRPPANRTPLAHEIERCGPYLLAQLSIIRPKAVVTLGGPASKLLLASELGITRLRGVWASVQLGAAGGAPFEVPVMPTFHPAYLLRNYTPETRRQVWDDLKKVLDLLGRTPPQRVRS